jgi:alpha-amylase/alpha-mannosidase (GH57 family)
VSGVSLAFLWHMHQPQYRPAGERVCLQPWVRLHACRSYYDMVRVLAEFPEVRVTFNLVPTLVEQIDAYVLGGSDLFRETARVPVADLDERQQRFLVDHFFSAQEERMIQPLPRYAELLELKRAATRRRGEEAAWREFAPADLRDLQVLFDLAWFGFKAAEEFAEIAALRRRGRAFTAADLTAVHATQDVILARVLGEYRAASDRGQAEVSASPWAHPILPLLIDSDCAREAMPAAVLPPRFAAPEDAALQIEEGLARVETLLGARPRGMWPSEGSLSRAAVALMAARGVAWAAGDIDVLRASARDGEADARVPWRLEGDDVAVDLVFRDHELSDRIGFTWARADPQAAVEELLAGTRARATGENPLVLVALDGENPWEHYADAGGPFLRALYGALSNGAAAGAGTRGSAGGGAAAGTEVVARTVSESLRLATRRATVRRLRPGSWIRADFGIWIGGPEKNRAWTLLGETRQRLAPLLADATRPVAERSAAWASLRAAEGSDWFWWLDGQFESRYRDDFDRLFRTHLKLACEALGASPPEALGWPIAGSDAGGATALRAGLLAATPVVDGYETDFHEWYGAPPIDGMRMLPAAAMQRAHVPIASVRAGLSPQGDLCVRIDPERQAGAALWREARVELRLVGPGAEPRVASLALDERGDPREVAPPGLAARARKVLEILLPAADAAVAPGGSVILFVRLMIGKETLVLREIEIRRPDPAPRVTGSGE